MKNFEKEFFQNKSLNYHGIVYFLIKDIKNSYFPKLSQKVINSKMSKIHNKILRQKNEVKTWDNKMNKIINKIKKKN